MFDKLTKSLSKIVDRINVTKIFDERNKKNIIREIRIILIESDVSLLVVNEFILRIKKNFLKNKSDKKLCSNKYLIKVIEKELTSLINFDLKKDYNNKVTCNESLYKILIVGFQGSGKTTTTIKLANFISKETYYYNKLKIKKDKILITSLDIYRPAAIKQLKISSDEIGIKCFTLNERLSALEIAIKALKYAKKKKFQLIIFDTAGRLGIDSYMMQELNQVNNLIKFNEILFVIDSMQGQDSLNISKAFSNCLPITGIILTKLDGDSKGGIALSVSHIIERPIKFIGTSEKIDGFEKFYAERIAKRIIGLGDILSLLDHAKKSMDLDESEKIFDKINNGKTFNLNDFKFQLNQIKNVGDINNLIKKLPIKLQNDNKKKNKIDKQINVIEGVLNSMTNNERLYPKIIKLSQKKRIAIGSGVNIDLVNNILKQFEYMKNVFDFMNKKNISNIISKIKNFNFLNK